MNYPSNQIGNDTVSLWSDLSEEETSVIIGGNQETEYFTPSIVKDYFPWEELEKYNVQYIRVPLFPLPPPPDPFVLPAFSKSVI